MQTAGASAAARCPTMFVYGTLMADEVVKLLINRVPASKPATVQGFARYRVRGQVFPAVLPSPGSRVSGKVLLELTPTELDILDYYESDEYGRQAVDAQLEDGATVAADMYVWKDDFKRLELECEWSYEAWRGAHLDKWEQLLLEQPDWDHAEFMASHLTAYLDMSREFMAEYHASQQQQQQ